MTETRADLLATPPRRRRSRRGRSTREALVRAAEQLIAEQGLARLSVSEIARAADQRSRAATQYYFNSLEEIAAAVLERRGPAIRERRAAMLAEVDRAGGGDLHAIVEAVVAPITELLGDSGAHFRCVAQLNALDPADPLQWLAPEEREHHEHCRERLRAELADVPETERRQRIEMIFDLCTATLAKLEARIEADPKSVSVAQASAGLVDAVTAILSGAGKVPG